MLYTLGVGENAHTLARNQPKDRERHLVRDDRSPYRKYRILYSAKLVLWQVFRCPLNGRPPLPPLLTDSYKNEMNERVRERKKERGLK